ncbi:sodium:solute symporter [Halomonas sp. McH1-25]|uniref:sodium:solute symporter n=1 Tax=unclassified Halomonas TaxID=2609666 RepID=UPI001EF4AF4F|nr:sodium:solute symporter [Halomonas sp. McH1-25]MCP1343159.1 sodium:solute symporter [Halomonas sp. FL8]MCP1360970.1 sodium:solute symporter [Halomonas sp. BBD45]
MSEFTWLDSVVLVVYIVAIAFIGARVGRGQASTQDYFLGGRKVPGWAIGLSVMATQASAITFIGAPGWGFEGGLERLVTFLNVPLAMAVLIFLFVPIFHRAGIYSIYELLERRFGPATRSLSALLFLIARGLATGVVLYAPALVLSVVTGWSVNLTIVVMAVLAVSYTVLGGISAVIWTDVIQMFVLWMGAIVSMFLMISSLPGGWADVFSYGAAQGMFNAIDLSLSPSVTYSLWAGLFGGVFLHIAYFGTDQSQIQRVLTSPSIQEGQRSLLIGGYLLVPQMLLFLFIGVMLATYYDQHGLTAPDNLNELFPRYVVNAFPSGLAGLVIAGVFAAAMSSLDSALNSLSAVSVRDFYTRYVRADASEAHYLKVSRWATVFWGVYATLFAFFAGNLGPVIEAVNRIGSWFYGALLGTFLLAMLSHRTNARGAFCGLVAGMAMVWWVSSSLDISWLYNNLIGVVTSVGVGYGVSLFSAAPRREQLSDVVIEETAPDMQALLSQRAERAHSMGPDARLTRRRCLGLIIWFFVLLAGLAIFQGWANA